MNQTGSSGGSKKGASEPVTPPAGLTAHSSTKDYHPGAVVFSQDGQTVISSRPPVDLTAVPNLAWASSLVGETLGVYEFLELVGSGGMGSVYRAKDTQLDRIVAVKVLAHQHGADEELLRRFRNEATSAARLDHRNIAQVFQVGEDRGLHFIVYEFIEGTNIRDMVLARGPLGLEDAISYTLQIAETLAHAYERDVVHRDIKPSNILVTGAGQAKLVDMGLARLRQVDHPEADLTATGVTLGTFDFISPEQAREPRSADVRSDLYSLGCTFYFMLTGQPPFPDGTVLQKLLSHQGTAPRDVRELRPEVPQDLAAVIDRMLAKAPEDRHQSPRELIGELVVVSDRIGLRPAGTATLWVVADSKQEPWWEKHIPWAVPVVILAVVVLALDYSWRRSAATGAGPPPLPPSHAPLASGPARPAPTARDGASGSVTPDVPAHSSADSPVKGATKSKTSTTEASARPIGEPSSSETTPAASDSPRVVVPPDSESEDPSERSQPRDAKDKPEPRPPGESSQPSARASDAPAASDPPIVRRSPEATEPQEPAIVRVVGETKADGVFTSLEKALADAVEAAKDEGTDRIHLELRYDGAREARPIAVEGMRLSISAAEGRSPTVIFRPDSVDPDDYARTMIRIASGELTVTGVHLLLHLPSDPAEEWSLVSAEDARAIRLVRSSLTIRNAADDQSALHRRVSFFHVPTRGPAASMMMSDAAKTPPAPLEIELERCLARGEATLLRAGSVQPVRLTWQSGFLATTERLLEADGLAQEPPRGALLRIRLANVTAIAGHGLCLMSNTQDAPYQMVVKLEADHCLLSGSPGATTNRPMVEQRGIDSVEDFRERLLYVGEQNAYDGFSVFWRIHGVGFETEQDLSYDQWKERWSGTDTLSIGPEQVAWTRLPPSGRPMHAHTPVDYVPNAARAESSSGATAWGCTPERLPKMPP